MTSERRRTEYMPLAEVLRAPRNAKRHRADLIGASMDRFGVVELPALDERTGRLVAGHGRLEDWQRRQDAGHPPPDGIELTADGGDWLVPVTRGWASKTDIDAEGYLITSNRTTELGGYDGDELADILTDIRDADDALLALTGYTGADVDAMLGTSDGPDDDTDSLGDPADDWLKVSFRCPRHVAAAWRQKVADHDGSEFKALAALLDVDPMFAPATDWTP